MHNDVVYPQEQNICQTWSRYVYRIKTGIKLRPLRCTGTLLPRNLCKLQKQNVALPWRTTRGRQSILQPSLAPQLA